MEVRKRNGFDEASLRGIVEEVSRDKYSANVELDTVTSDRRGRVERFKLRAVESGARTLPSGYSAPGARRSSSGMRTVAACWHAHRDILRAVFEAFPRATIVTAMARYDGLEGFEATYPSTAYRNIGSMMQPATMPTLCDCSDWEGQ